MLLGFDTEWILRFCTLLYTERILGLLLAVLNPANTADGKVWKLCNFHKVYRVRKFKKSTMNVLHPFCFSTVQSHTKPYLLLN